MFAAAFMLSGDFNPSHIAAADKPSVAFRIGPFAQKAQLWYPRPDYESVADYLREVVKEAPDDLFVVRACPPVARQFHPRRYATYLPRSSFRFYELSRERGTRDVWERRLLLSTFEELREASRSDQTVWLIRPLWRADSTPARGYLGRPSGTCDPRILEPRWGNSSVAGIAQTLMEFCPCDLACQFMLQINPGCPSSEPSTPLLYCHLPES